MGYHRNILKAIKSSIIILAALRRSVYGVARPIYAAERVGNPAPKKRVAVASR